jgi:hypothetical protein
MNVKPLYKSANLPYLLFQSPGIRKNKPRTKMVIDPNEVVFPAGKTNNSVKNIVPKPMVPGRNQ